MNPSVFPTHWLPTLSQGVTPWLMGLVTMLLLWIAAGRLRRRWRRWRHLHRVRLRRRKAHRAEADAAGVLRAHGYAIMEDQATHTWEVWLDDHPHEVELRADYLVTKGRKRFVAEVKSGVMAPSIDTAATRRQLLEYRMAYDVDGILLVDMEAVEIYVVEFDLSQGAAGPPPSRLLWFGWGVAMAWACWAGWSRWGGPF